VLVGHLAVALGAKRLRPGLSLGVLIAAAFALDLLWPIFLLIGLERVAVDPGNTRVTNLAFVHYPWTHSLAAAGFWGAVSGAALAGRARPQAALLVAAVVVSHWILDFITHRPDLPLWPGGPLAGLGLWNSIPGTAIVEGGLSGAAIAAYAGRARLRGLRAWAFWGVLALLALLWASQPWAPPPPGPTAVAAGALVMWILPLWGWWLDSPTPAGPAATGLR
jgi:hypothetical protein